MSFEEDNLSLMDKMSDPNNLMHLFNLRFQALYREVYFFVNILTCPSITQIPTSIIDILYNHFYILTS